MLHHPPGSPRMSQSQLLKLALVVGLVLLVGMHLPSPWRASLPVPTDPWEQHMAGAGGEEKHQEQGAGSGGRKLVAVDVYGESLCPDTTHAIKDVIAPLFANGIAGVMRLRYYAYGKVTETGQGLECQHGELECRMNRFLNCAQELHPNQTDWLPYAACVHGNYGRSIEAAAAERCPGERGWSGEELQACAKGELGDKLEKQAQEATKALGKLTFVPWILVDGKPMGYEFDGLAKTVCAAAAEGSRPEACGKVAGGARL